VNRKYRRGGGSVRQARTVSRCQASDAGGEKSHLGGEEKGGRREGRESERLLRGEKKK